MFGNKKKLEAKIRFQKTYFRSRLKQARSYKRPIKTIPTTNWDIFLFKLGLGSWQAKLASVLVLASAVYLIFVPNVFFVKTIVINGLKLQDQTEAATTANFYLQQHNPWPQRNLLLLSERGLENYLTANNPKILRVESLEKKFPNTLVINLQPRFTKFLLSFPSRQYLASNDGLILQAVSANEPATSSLFSNLSPIKLTADDTPGLGQKYLSPELISLISQINQRLPKTLRTSITDFEMLNINDLDLKIDTQAGYQIIVDEKSDFSQTANELALLLSNFSPGDMKKLLYVDLRFKNRGYVCMKDAPCARPTILPQTSSTPDSNLPANP